MTENIIQKTGEYNSREMKLLEIFEKRKGLSLTCLFVINSRQCSYCLLYYKAAVHKMLLEMQRCWLIGYKDAIGRKKF